MEPSETVGVPVWAPVTLASTNTAPDSITTLGVGSSSPFPIVSRVWDVFASKSIRTIFLTIGNSSSSVADLELAESIGCRIHVCPLTSTEEGEWKEIQEILKERKREGAFATYPFTVGAEAKWILPKNIRIQGAIPWWGEGTIRTTAGDECKTTDVYSMIEKVCEDMKLKDGGVRLDILKIDTSREAPGLERAILPAILNAGFRPTLVLVHWNGRPDIELSYTLAAGHLQNCGYKLMAMEGDNFLYYFIDNDLYQLCSWEETKVANPLLDEIARSANELYRNSPS